MAVTTYGPVLRPYYYRHKMSTNVDLAPLLRSGSFYSSYRIVERPFTTGRIRPVGSKAAVFKQGTARSGYRIQQTNGFAPRQYISKLQASDYLYTYDITMQDCFASSAADRKLTTEYTAMGTEVLNKLRNKTRKQGVNLGLMMAEYRQTSKLFVSGAQKLISLTSAAVRRDPRLLKKGFGPATSKSLAKNHLEYVYGVEPLVMDLHEAAGSIRTAGLRDAFQVVYTSANRTRSTSRSVLSTCMYQDAPKSMVDVQIEEHVKLLLEAVVEFDHVLLLSSMGSVGLTNPFSLAYELVPFSFVVDWWINVGDVLASLDNLLYFKNIWYQTSRRHYYRQYSEVDGITGFYGRLDYDRSAPLQLTSFVNTFQYKPSASLRHVLNGLSLLRVNRKRLFGS